MGNKILIVEDETIIGLDVENILTTLGYEVSGVVRTGKDCLKKISAYPPELVLMDIRLEGDMDGIETAGEIYKNFDIPVVFLAAHAEDSFLENAKQTAPYGYILKPVTANDLHSAIEIALYKHKLDNRLRESEGMLKKAESIAHIGTFKHDAVNEGLVFSDEMYRLFGLTPEKFDGTLSTAFQCIHPDDRWHVAEISSSAVTSQIPYDIEYRVIHPDGSMRYLFSRGDVVCDKAGNFIEVIGTAQDITERKNSEKRIKHLNNLLRAIRNINQLITHENDKDKLIKGACRNLIETGVYSSSWIALYDETKNYITSSEECFDDVDFNHLKENLKNKNLPSCVKNAFECRDIILVTNPDDYCKECSISEKYKKKAKILLRLEYNEKIYGILTVHFDLVIPPDEEELTLLKELSEDIAFALNNIDLEAEREKLQLQLIHSEKLSAVGQLAAGVAHEFNNFLNIIIGRSQLSLDAESIDEIKESLQIIKDVSWRGSDLVKNLGSFARPKEPKLKKQDITDLIDQVIRLQKRQLELENIQVKRRYVGQPKIEFDWGQMEQVFLNLFINAVHAIKPKGKGTIQIEVKSSDHKAEIRFSDTGTGMDDTVKSKIFDPFFTTKLSKDNSEITGSGLGLSVSNNIIKRHNGTIAVDTEKDKGTTFIISLPLSSNENDAADVMKTSEEVTAAEQFRDMRILVVDDEKEMVDFMRIIFKRSGFKNVVIKDKSDEAISIFKSFNPDLVFLDLGMPNISGESVFKEFMSIKRDARIIFMSGKLNVDHNQYLQNGAFDFIHKPFEMKTIFEAIKKAGLCIKTDFV